MLDPKKLFNENRTRLRMRWVAGRQAHGCEISVDNMHILNWGEYGDSLIHHQLRIIKSDQWILLNDQEKLKFCHKICSTKPFSILLANGIGLTDPHLRLFDQADLPLFTSPLPAERLASELNFFKRALLGESQMLHGVFMEVQGVGTLLTGESGVGKSELALALISNGHRFIADDATEFWRTGADVSGACPHVLQDFIEVRGLGFLDIRSLFGDSAIKLRKNLQLIIHLENMPPEKLKLIDRSQHIDSHVEVQGIEVPQITLPVTAGRQLAILIETAVRVHIQRRQGYDSNRNFSERQRTLLSE